MGNKAKNISLEKLNWKNKGSPVQANDLDGKIWKCLRKTAPRRNIKWRNFKLMPPSRRLIMKQGQQFKTFSQMEHLKTPIDLEGLGIVDIRQSNKALLKLDLEVRIGKRSPMEESHSSQIWLPTFWSEGGWYQQCFLKSPWKYIMKQKDLIIHNIQCKPGKGASTTFWSGTCCNLQLVYSNLFVLVNSKEVSIVCVWNSENGAWTGISEETLRMRKFPNGPLFLTSSLASF